MMQLQLTDDVLATVFAFTGNRPTLIDNDRRKSYQRRYTLAVKSALNIEQVKGINAELRNLQPKLQFTVQTSKFMRRNRLIVKVFDTLVSVN